MSTRKSDAEQKVVLDQTAVPETAAASILMSWLAALNSADSARICTFDVTHQGEAVSPDQWLAFREMTGGFTLLRIEKSESSSLVALLQEENSDTLWRLELSTDAEEPAKRADVSLLATPRPVDLAIPRMTQDDAVAALSARAEYLAKNDQLSGTLLIARHSKVLVQKAWGHANHETGAPMTLDTQLRVGSMNKMFTAIATLQLVESGKLVLDDAIGKYFPEYPNRDAALKVSVRHLLTHTGGTGDIFGPEFMANRTKLREHSDYVTLYGSRALLHEPGAEQRYSNFGFILLGALIEKVSGMSYYEYVRANIFTPAGMMSTDSLPEANELANRAIGYMRRDRSWVSNADTLPWRGTAAGGGYSTVTDLFRFAEVMESGKLLSRAMLSEATRAQHDWCGYCFLVQGEGSLRSYGHAGGAPGMNGNLRVFPQLGYVLASLSNLDPPTAERLVQYFALRMPVKEENS